LTTGLKNQLCDFIVIKCDEKMTVTIMGCRMVNFVSYLPAAIENKNALVQVITYIDKYENYYNYADSP
jgi:hypothetical protein